MKKEKQKMLVELVEKDGNAYEDSVLDMRPTVIDVEWTTHDAMGNITRVYECLDFLTQEEIQERFSIKIFGVDYEKEEYKAAIKDNKKGEFIFWVTMPRWVRLKREAKEDVKIQVHFRI